MDTSLFITIAYSVTVLLLLALLVASLLRARAVNRQLGQLGDQSDA